VLIENEATRQAVNEETKERTCMIATIFVVDCVDCRRRAKRTTINPEVSVKKRENFDGMTTTTQQFIPLSSIVMWGSLQRSASLLAFVASRGSLPVGTRSISSTTSLAANQYLLRYEYIPDVLEKRGPYREGHLDIAKQMIEEGKCLSGGPIGMPGAVVPSGAMFIFNDEESAKAFVEVDPYVSNGIVTGHSIEEWNVVVQKE
jgi:hypothetical protein